MSSSSKPYPIGRPGVPWGEAEKREWLSQQTRRRSYQAEVLEPLDALGSRFDLVQYGELHYAPDRYPLFAIRSRGWREDRPHVLVTGGVHGYETSGVQGALRFIDRYGDEY